MSAIERCRTAALGGHVARCVDCAHTVIAYNSYRNRHCPKCQGAPAKQWLAELLHSVCFDCHANAHQNGATHLDPSIRPEWFRHRLKTVSLRGVNIQRLFGSQRALKTIEDFTEFEQRTAYFDGDIVEATKKGVNPLERAAAKSTSWPTSRK